MTSKDWISAALRALAEHDQGREAPGEVETRLLAAFRRRRARRKARTVALATLAVAAGITLFFARPQPRPTRVAPMPVIRQPVAVAAAPGRLPIQVPKATPQ